MKIAIDPGHGMSNAKPNVYDPGATTKVGTETYAEADIVLRYGLTLRKCLEDQGIGTFLTRTSSADSAPVRTRAARARKAGCTHLVSLHLNSYSAPSARGVEVQYRDAAKDKPLADRIQARLLELTGFHDHGNDRRLDLAVLKFTPGPAVLIELGFLSNPADRDYLIHPANRDRICAAIAEVVTAGPRAHGAPVE